MRRTAKIVSVVLAVLMVLTVVPFAAFAADTSDDRLAGWKANYQLFLDTMLDNSNYTSWNYVNLHRKNLDTQYNVMTAFALYDGAWRNYATKNVSIENAEQILLGLIEKAEYTFDDGYVDEIVKVLETAQDVDDFIQKVNQYADLDILEFTKSSEYGTVFQVIDTVVNVAHLYQNYRQQFIEAYARVLSVQKANIYYIDMLQYIIDHAPSGSVLIDAAHNLIDKMEASVGDVIQQLIVNAAADGTELGINMLLTYAMNSNVYTATVLKVYGVASSVANVLWNTANKPYLIDTLLTSFDFQALIAEWTALSLDDADKALIAVDTLLTARAISENALYNLKLAENQGVIDKVKNQLYGTVYEDIEISLAAIEAMRSAMFDKDVADFKPVKRAIYAYCPIDIQILNADNSGVYTLKDGRVVNEEADSGIYVSVYSDYSKDYLKFAFLYDTYKVRLSGTADGTVTLIMDVLNDDGSVDDWSFTDRVVAEGTKIVFDTAFSGTPYYLASDTDAKTYFNDVFVESEKPDVTVKDVANAVVAVGKKEAKSFIDIIKEFFQNLFANITKAFANIFKK